MARSDKLQAIYQRFDGDRSGSLCVKEFLAALSEMDSRLSSHPATAQVANQQGEYLATQLNALAKQRKQRNANGGGDSSPELETPPRTRT